jgi:uncharacterized protein
VDFDVNVTLVAVVVGALVGLTGVGAGALMTPVLIAGFGVSPAVAIATDLLYASVTKLVGGLTHLRHGGVQWPVLRRLWAGGLIGVSVGVSALLFLVETTVASDVLRIPLALVILLAAASLLWRAFRRQSQPNPIGREGDGPPVVLTTAGGAGIGLAVSLTSVGAGALGMALLTRVSSRGTSPRALVGTDLLFAVPVALVSGVSYFVGGLVDLELLAHLLIGSLPGVLLGSALAGKAPARLLNLVIGLALIAAAFTMVSSLFAV